MADKANSSSSSDANPGATSSSSDVEIRTATRKPVFAVPIPLSAVKQLSSSATSAQKARGAGKYAARPGTPPPGSKSG
ncbi:hypothetical protein MY4038_003793 [Beauveria bassiana]